MRSLTITGVHVPNSATIASTFASVRNDNTTSGATLATALDIAAEADDGAAILAMLPDTGERYLSTPLFEGVNEGSDDEWLETI